MQRSTPPWAGRGLAGARRLKCLGKDAGRPCVRHLHALAHHDHVPQAQRARVPGAPGTRPLARRRAGAGARAPAAMVLWRAVAGQPTAETNTKDARTQLCSHRHTLHESVGVSTSSAGSAQLPPLRPRCEPARAGGRPGAGCQRVGNTPAGSEGVRTRSRPRGSTGCAWRA